MLFPTEGENNILYGECHICGNKEEITDYVVQETNYKKINIQDINTNNNMVYDNALPLTKKKECPNKDCPSKKNKKLQQAVILTDPKTIKQFYVCTVCKTEWKYA